MKDFNIVKNYKIWFGISGAIILLGLVLMMFNGLNLGIDFTGGTMMQIEIGKTVPVAEIKTLISEFNLSPEILHAGSEKTEIVIKTKQSLSNDIRLQLFEVVKTEYALTDDALRGAEQFGPSIGSEIQKRALLAVLIASLAMLIYISIRFETVFGMAAIIALIHDVLVLLAIYSIFNITVNSSFIAAVLTIVGYSINDTIVVFDRIRENVKREKNKSHYDIADGAIKQTLSRTINTSVTTILVIGALFVLGVTSIKEFAFPLLVGVSVGTYSSIFIASPIWAILKDKIKNKNAYGTN